MVSSGASYGDVPGTSCSIVVDDITASSVSGSYTATLLNYEVSVLEPSQDLSIQISGQFKIKR